MKYFGRVCRWHFTVSWKRYIGRIFSHFRNIFAKARMPTYDKNWFPVTQYWGINVWMGTKHSGRTTVPEMIELALQQLYPVREVRIMHVSPRITQPSKLRFCHTCCQHAQNPTGYFVSLYNHCHGSSSSLSSCCLYIGGLKVICNSLGRVTSLLLASPVVGLLPFSPWTGVFCSISSAVDGTVIRCLEPR
jgi:hypothetical protein